jgi:hypothetical protein
MATGARMSTTAAKAAMAPWGQIEQSSDDELALKKPNGKKRFNSVPTEGHQLHYDQRIGESKSENP